MLEQVLKTNKGSAYHKSAIECRASGANGRVPARGHVAVPRTHAPHVSLVHLEVGLQVLDDSGLLGRLGNRHEPVCVCVGESVSVCVCAIHEAPAKRELRLY